MTAHEPITEQRRFGDGFRSAPPDTPADAMAVAIRAAHLTKTFRLPRERRITLREHLFHPRSRDYVVFEALQDVSFDVRRGEWLGIVGRNGSGKSTLLRCLAGIYVPDSGVAYIEGRAAPFIELGVGFNPELPARENVIQSAVLFGLDPADAAARFERILAFAELERFARQKLKNYSSGMAARLAFAVAINVDADVLLFDEVLAVGDEVFKKKCLDHFERLREQGKTVVLVTHGTSTIERYCDRALLLEGGRMIEAGSPEAIVERYETLTSQVLAQGTPPVLSPPFPYTADSRAAWPVVHALRRFGHEAGRLMMRPLRAIARRTLGGARRAPLGPPLKRSSMLGPDPHRFLVLTRLLATNEFRLKYAGTVFDYAWALAHPAALFGVLLLVFGHFGRFNRNIEHYAAYLLLAIVLWTFFSQAATSSVGCLRRRAVLLRKLPFPRLAIPFSTILTAVIDLALSLAVAIVFVLAVGVTPRLSWLELPLILGVVGAFATGLACLLSVLYVRFRDIDQVWSIVSRLLFFLTPIFYVAATVPAPLRKPLLLVNPLAAAFTEMRHAVIDPGAPSVASVVGGYPMLLVPLAIVLGTLGVGLWAFARFSPRAAEYV